MASSITAPTLATTAVERPLWSTVYAMGLCSFALIASEFLPVSLLSPIAADLHLTEGQAGQAISISGVFALLTSLSVIALAGCLDRKHVLLGLTTLLMVSGVLVALAPSYAALMAGRALLGFAIGGFWSMLAANAMRLVPANTVITAFAVINGGQRHRLHGRSPARQLRGRGDRMAWHVLLRGARGGHRPTLAGAVAAVAARTGAPERRHRRHARAAT